MAEERVSDLDRYLPFHGQVFGHKIFSDTLLIYSPKDSHKEHEGRGDHEEKYLSSKSNYFLSFHC